MSDSGKDLPETRLVRELYFNRTGLLFLLTVLLAMGMSALAAHTHGDASTFWLTLATGIAATSASAAFAVLLTTKQFDAFLRTTIAQSVEEHVSLAARQLLSIVPQRTSIYIPLTSY